MEIDINQQKLALGARYHIFINKQPTHVASQHLLQTRRQVQLFASKADTRPRWSLYQQLTWFSLHYQLTRWDRNVLDFRTESVWKSHYRCRYGADVYDIYGHRGTKHSVYKNERQIAWWQQARVTWFEGDNYKLWADEDSDAELLIAFCLVLDEPTSSGEDQNTLTLNLGAIGPQARVFDQTWQPK
jgi:hypothetical protein